MEVTANKLFNYIRCRRFAALNDANSPTDSLKYNNYYQKNISKFKDIFLGLNFYDKLSYVKDINYTYDFHHDFTLSEDYDFIFNDKDIYILISASSKEFLKLKYKFASHTHQLFKKNSQGHYQLDKSGKNSVNYQQKLNKLFAKNEISGQVILKYAFMQYLYKNVFPKKEFNLYFVLINEEYVHDGIAYTDKLYHIFDFSNLDDLDNKIEISLFRMINHIELNDFTPCELERNACLRGKQLQCKFVDFCYSHLPKENSIFDYFNPHLGFKEKLKKTYIHHDIYELLNEGYIKMEDIPMDWLKNKNRLMQRYCLDNNVTYINKEKINIILSHLKYPLVFLDLSYMPIIIPKFKHEKPFDNISFQYSLFTQKENEKIDLDSDSYLHNFKESRSDNRNEFAEKFVNDVLRYDSSIIVYKKPQIIKILQGSKSIFPHLKSKLEIIIDRVVDILDILKIDPKFFKDLNIKNVDLSTYNFYDNKLSGSYSRSKLAKVFNFEKINDLTINDDKTEYKIFRLFNDNDESTKDKLKRDMMIYSKHKAYLLYKIIDKLKQMIST
ncbi:MAG: DUF2779 domain-containing protein [Candidatus Izemoplasmatales bacterium]